MLNPIDFHKDGIFICHERATGKNLSDRIRIQDLPDTGWLLTFPMTYFKKVTFT